MNANSSSDDSPPKRSGLLGLAALIFQLLRMVWLLWLSLLLVVLYGLRAGWTTSRQWSDGLFIAAILQVIVGASMMARSVTEDQEAAAVQYVAGSNVSETRQEMLMIALRQQSFGVRAFIGSLVTILISVIVGKM